MPYQRINTTKRMSIYFEHNLISQQIEKVNKKDYLKYCYGGIILVLTTPQKMFKVNSVASSNVIIEFKIGILYYQRVVRIVDLLRPNERYFFSVLRLPLLMANKDQLYDHSF